MTDLVQRLRHIKSPTCGEAADRIEQLTAGVVEQCNVNLDLRMKLEQLERMNSVKELNYQQAVDDLAAARRENAELRKQVSGYSWPPTKAKWEDEQT